LNIRRSFDTFGAGHLERERNDRGKHRSADHSFREAEEKTSRHLLTKDEARAFSPSNLYVNEKMAAGQVIRDRI